MTNAVLTAKNAPGVTAKLVAVHLREKAKFIKSIRKEEDEQFKQQYNVANPGDTVYVKKPARFTVGSTLDITSTIQDIKEEKVALTLDKLANVAFQMTSLETAYDRPISYWNDNFVEPAMNALAAEMDRWALEKAALATANLVGTAGTQPGTVLDFLEAGEMMFRNLVPEDDNLFAMISPATNTKTVNERKGLFHRSDLISEQYARGYIGQGEGLTYLRSNLMPTFTNGNDITGVAVEATVLAPATGATQLGVDGLTTTTGTVTAGQNFTIANVFSVHPLTKASTGELQQFTVTANATADGAGTATLSITPTIYGPTSGSLQNVNALPADEALLTFFGAASTAYTQNMVYHMDAFRFVSVPLYTPKGMDFAASETVDGISVRALRDFDIRTSQSIMRFDILGGLCAVRPEWASRVTGLS